MTRSKVPTFLEANNKEELVRMMNAVQFNNNLTVQFFDFQKDGKKWVCWFQLPIRKD